MLEYERSLRLPFPHVDPPAPSTPQTPPPFSSYQWDDLTLGTRRRSERDYRNAGLDVQRVFLNKLKRKKVFKKKKIVDVLCCRELSWVCVCVCVSEWVCVRQKGL